MCRMHVCSAPHYRITFTEFKLVQVKSTSQVKNGLCCTVQHNPFLTRDVLFTAAVTLPGAVTLTFDRLTLNVYNVSAVM